MRDQLEALIQQMVEKGIRYDAAVQDFEKFYIGRVLERVKGNQSRAARMLGMHRNTLSRKIGEYHLSVDFRQRPESLPAAGIRPASAARPLGRALQAASGAGRASEVSNRLYGRR